MPRAFISHSSPDDGYVAEFDSLLCSLGFEVFNDVRSIKPDRKFWPEIEAGIRDCDVFFVVITPASMNSRWVKDEIAFADSINKEVRPVWIEDCELPPRFADRDVIDFRPKSRVKSRKLAPSKLTRHAARNFFGRDDELALLDRAWADSGTHVLSIIAWGGVGKTALVTQWVATRLIARGWPGVERYFDWSFYSQGTGEARQTSSDLFMHEALKFFGDPDPTVGTPWERGQRLAGLVRQHKTLLVLDGIEPLQYPPTDRSGQGGRLKDQGLESLLQSLAQENTGLCIVTSREHLANIDCYPTQREHKLDKLLLDAAIGLIRHLQLIGTDDEIEQMWEQLDGHALSILQLGRLLARGYGKDLRKWREIGFTKADKLHQGRSTMRVMAKYESWLAGGDQAQQLELAILRLLGLFERPMSPDCFAALRDSPTIPGLTELFAQVEPFELEAAITTLVENELLSHGGGDGYAGRLLDVALDAHPLIREYFAQQLQRDQAAAFESAHARLFEHLCKTTEYQPDTLDGLAPLYEAVVHGCLAGRQQESLEQVYRDRILRGSGQGGFYSTFILGAIGADLAAAAAFFEVPWSRVTSNLTETDQSLILTVAAFNLRSLGRLTESLDPMRYGLEKDIALNDWKNAAISANNLSELELSLGRLKDALSHSHDAIIHADKSGDVFMRVCSRTTKADVFQQSGEQTDAGELFNAAVKIHREWQRRFDFLRSVQGFKQCEWLLATAERTAWYVMLQCVNTSQASNSHLQIRLSSGHDTYDAVLTDVELRGNKSIESRLPSDPLLDIALDHLTLARVGLLRAILTPAMVQPTLDLPHVAAAVNGLRRAGDMVYLPRGLLTAAWYHFVRGEPDLARTHLAEVEQIARRGPMPLFLADIHLYRARFFRDKAELAEAAKLIRSLGYGRRYDELADAEAALTVAD